MDPQEFIKKLSKVSKWRIPVYGDNANSLRKIRKDVEQTNANPTVPPVVEDIITAPKPCEWCQIICHQETTYTLLKPNRQNCLAKPYWIEYCKTCKMYRNRLGKLIKYRPFGNQLNNL